VNGQFLTQPVTGVQRYAREALAALVALGPDDFEFMVACPRRKYRGGADGLPLVFDDSRLPGTLWQQVRLPSMAARLKADLVWSPCNVGPFFAKNHVVTMHDASVLAHPHWFSPFFRAYYGLSWRILGRTARLIVTDSEFSKSEIARLGIAPAARIRVVSAGVGAAFKPAANGRAQRYVLSVGSRDPRKNLRGMLAAWSALGADVKQGRRLIVAGGNPENFAAERIVPGPDVDLEGYVTDARLAELYAGADAFVYPSLYEGFGLPPLEAMASGTPVVVSRAASLPEVCGDAAVYVDPRSTASIAEGLGRVLTEAALREKLVKAGKVQAGRFTWIETAKKLLEVFHEIVGEK
jgi:glycosyltransferase involved in cell wall biosynthesis